MGYGRAGSGHFGECFVQLIRVWVGARVPHSGLIFGRVVAPSLAFILVFASRWRVAPQLDYPGDRPRDV